MRQRAITRRMLESSLFFHTLLIEVAIADEHEVRCLQQSARKFCKKADLTELAHTRAQILWCATSERLKALRQTPADD